VHTLSGKPNSYHDSADGEEDGKWFLWLLNVLQSCEHNILY